MYQVIAAVVVIGVAYIVEKISKKIDDIRMKYKNLHIEEDIEDGDNSPSKLQGLKDKLSNLNDDLLSQKKLF